jgi:hypothetical protein
MWQYQHVEHHGVEVVKQSRKAEARNIIPGYFSASSLKKV